LLKYLDTLMVKIFHALTDLLRREFTLFGIFLSESMEQVGIKVMYFDKHIFIFLKSQFTSTKEREEL
jgi:hypothetical protein